MKEHFQEQLYDHELNQNTIIDQKMELQTQLKKNKEILKITQDKLK